MNTHKIINIIMVVLIAVIFASGVYAATRAIVPRADTEGSIGTAAKQWGGVYGVEAYISALTDHGVVVGGGTGALDALAIGTNGQVLIGSTTADPVFATLNCDTALTCTTGAGTLEIDVDDAFLKNNASDIMTGTLTADGLTLGANENITLGSQTLDHDGTTFVFNDDVNVTGTATSTISNDLLVGGNTSSTDMFISGLLHLPGGMCIGEDTNTTTPNVTIQACSEF